MSTREIFRPGTFVSAEGVKVNITSEMLKEIAGGYDPKVHEAPIVVGHPQLNAPAYGWVAGLSFNDGVLLADEHQLNPDFEAQRKAGAYKKVSASLYTPDAPGNPTPGKYALRHVGYLGATPPSLKGLNQKAINFAEAEEGVLTFGELPGYAGSVIARILGGLRDFLIGQHGQEAADKAINSYDLEYLRSSSQRADEAPGDGLSGTSPLGFAEPGGAGPSSNASTSQEKPSMTTKTQEQLLADNAQLQADLAASKQRETALMAANAKRDADARHAGNVSFAEGLVAKAQMPKGMQDVLVATLDRLDTPGDTGVVSFGEGEQAQPLGDAFRAELQKLPAQLSFGEFAKKGEGGSSGRLSDREVATRARAYQAAMSAKGVSISTPDAVAAVHAGNDKA